MESSFRQFFYIVLFLSSSSGNFLKAISSNVTPPTFISNLNELFGGLRFLDHRFTKSDIDELYENVALVRQFIKQNGDSKQVQLFSALENEVNALINATKIAQNYIQGRIKEKTSLKNDSFLKDVFQQFVKIVDAIDRLKIIPPSQLGWFTLPSKRAAQTLLYDLSLTISNVAGKAGTLLKTNY